MKRALVGLAMIAGCNRFDADVAPPVAAADAGTDAAGPPNDAGGDVHSPTPKQCIEPFLPCDAFDDASLAGWGYADTPEGPTVENGKLVSKLAASNSGGDGHRVVRSLEKGVGLRIEVTLEVEAITDGLEIPIQVFSLDVGVASLPDWAAVAMSVVPVGTTDFYQLRVAADDARADPVQGVHDFQLEYGRPIPVTLEVRFGSSGFVQVRANGVSSPRRQLTSAADRAPSLRLGLSRDEGTSARRVTYDDLRVSELPADF